MNRLTDNDKSLGRLVVYGRTNWKTTALYLSSGGDDEDESVPAYNLIYLRIFGWVFRIVFFRIIEPFKIKHIAESWDEATVARLGRNYYHEIFPREFGFRVSGESLVLYLGAQTHDSDTTKSKHINIPWRQWRFVRFSLYNLAGDHFWTQLESDRKRGEGPSFRFFEEQMKREEACPKAKFEFEDFDGKRITVTTHIQEREWRWGGGWFKWLSFFRKPKIRRSLDLRFSEEVGPEKGSWKGGTIGCGIDMLQGELHEDAFRRYCGTEHDARGRKYRIQFIGNSQTEPCHSP